MKFNEAQKTALSHKTGPMMVLAGPGSGKTTVITHRIAGLLESGVRPSEILVITFTKASAREMEERFYSLRPAVRENDTESGRVPSTLFFTGSLSWRTGFRRAVSWGRRKNASISGNFSKIPNWRWRMRASSSPP